LFFSANLLAIFVNLAVVNGPSTAINNLNAGDALTCAFSDQAVNSMFSDPPESLDRPGVERDAVRIEIIDGARQSAIGSGLYGGIDRELGFTHQGGAITFVHSSPVDLERGSVAVVSVFPATAEEKTFRANLFVQLVRARLPVMTSLSIGRCTLERANL